MTVTMFGLEPNGTTLMIQNRESRANVFEMLTDSIVKGGTVLTAKRIYDYNTAFRG